MSIESEGGRLCLRPVELSGEAIVDGLLRRLTSYSLAVDGVAWREDGARHFLMARPPGLRASAKHTFVVEHSGAPVGLVDLIDGWPTAGTATIGLLAIAEDLHGQGLGHHAYALVERFVRDQCGCRSIRIAVVATNPVIGFWHRMGFVETGEKKPYEGLRVSTTCAILTRGLAQEDSIV
jgi:GNAT superfamily N-acetyltransferase